MLHLLLILIDIAHSLRVVRMHVHVQHAADDEGEQLAQIATDCRTAIETELCQCLHKMLGDEICVNF